MRYLEKIVKNEKIVVLMLLLGLAVFSTQARTNLELQAADREENRTDVKSESAKSAKKTEIKDEETIEEEEQKEQELSLKKAMAMQKIEKLHEQQKSEEEKRAEAAAQAQAEAEALAEQLSQETEIEAVEAAIVPGQYPIMGQSSIQVSQMVAYFYANGGSYPSAALGDGGATDIETFCQIYYEEAVAEGVRPEVAFAQTMKETGWLKYGGDASISQYNFAGLGTTGGGVAGNSYPDVRTGVRAQIQHLKAYATAEGLNEECVDSRYDYVAKGCAPYVEWLGQQENPEGYGWATGANYGYDIVDMIHAMRGF